MFDERIKILKENENELEGVLDNVIYKINFRYNKNKNILIITSDENLLSEEVLKDVVDLLYYLMENI